MVSVNGASRLPSGNATEDLMYAIHQDMWRLTSMKAVARMTKGTFEARRACGERLGSVDAGPLSPLPACGSEGSEGPEDPGSAALLPVQHQRKDGEETPRTNDILATASEDSLLPSTPKSAPPAGMQDETRKGNPGVVLGDTMAIAASCRPILPGYLPLQPASVQNGTIQGTWRSAARNSVPPTTWCSPLETPESTSAIPAPIEVDSLTRTGDSPGNAAVFVGSDAPGTSPRMPTSPPTSVRHGYDLLRVWLPMPEDWLHPLSLVVAMYSLVSESPCADISFRATNSPDGAAPAGGSNAARGVSGTRAGVAGASSTVAAKQEAANMWLEKNCQPIKCTVPIGDNQSRASYMKEKRARTMQVDNCEDIKCVEDNNRKEQDDELRAELKNMAQSVSGMVETLAKEQEEQRLQRVREGLRREREGLQREREAKMKDLGNREKALEYKKELVKLLEAQTAGVGPTSDPDSNIESTGSQKEERTPSGRGESREKLNPIHAPTSDVPNRGPFTVWRSIQAVDDTVIDIG